jgi:uncharacterized protein (TIGR02466 family)
MEMLELFPTVVGTTQRNDLSDHSAVFSALKNEWAGDPINSLLCQTHNQIHKIKELNSITEFVTQSVVEYLQQHQFTFDPADLYVASCWANAGNTTSKTHETHYHFNSFVSAVYYLAAPEGSGSLYFPHPNIQAYLLQPNIGQSNKLNSIGFRMRPEAGKCVIFRSSTAHGVHQNNLKPTDTRLSIGYTFNIKRIGENSHSSNYEEL